MKKLFFLFVPLIMIQFAWSAPVGITPDQAEIIREQRESFGDVPEREIEYYRETAPRDPDADHDFLLKDHPLQEKPLQERMIK